MKTNSELKKEFVEEHRHEVFELARALYCARKDGRYYPNTMKIDTDFGSFLITKLPQFGD